MKVPIHNTRYYKEITIQVEWNQIKKGMTKEYERKLTSNGYEFSHITYPSDHDEHYYYHYKKSVELVLAPD